MVSSLSHNSVSQIQMLTDEQFLQRIPQYGLLYLLKECSERDNLSSLRIVSYWNRCIAWAGYILIGVAKIQKQIFSIQTANMILFQLQQKPRLHFKQQNLFFYSFIKLVFKEQCSTLLVGQTTSFVGTISNSLLPNIILQRYLKTSMLFLRQI